MSFRFNYEGIIDLVCSLVSDLTFPESHQIHDTWLLEPIMAEIRMCTVSKYLINVTSTV